MKNNHNCKRVTWEGTKRYHDRFEAVQSKFRTLFDSFAHQLSQKGADRDLKFLEKLFSSVKTHKIFAAIGRGIEQRLSRLRKRADGKLPGSADWAKELSSV